MRDEKRNPDKRRRALGKPNGQRETENAALLRNDKEYVVQR
jgi:hypothetical protein